MRTEKGVIIIAYQKPGRKNRYMVLQRKKNWDGWELPKGHLEEDDYEHTVELELQEEAGIEEDHIEKIEGLDHTVEWSFEDEEETVNREYRAFLVKVSDASIIRVSENPHDEHETGFFLSKQDVKGLLTYEEHVEALEIGAEQIDES